MFWLPKPLYESMPYIWITGGLVAINGQLPITGELSGILLFCAGAFVILMRLTHRSQ